MIEGCNIFVDLIHFSGNKHGLEVGVLKHGLGRRTIHIQGEHVTMAKLIPL